MKKWGPGIVVAVALVLVALTLRGRDRLPATPSDAINAFFEAQEKGDDWACLRLTCGDLRASLQQARDQAGAEAFRQSLVRSATGIKGLAISGGGDTPGDRVAVDVEIVFTDRNERQRMVLVRQSGGWAIAAIERAQVEKQAIPYGTPVFEELSPAEKPEGEQ